MSYISGQFDRLRRAHPNLLLFVGSMALMGIAHSMFDTTFNNFLSDTFKIGADKRGFLEFPRELPGFLTALFAGALFFVAETHIAAIAALGVGVGMISLALWGGNWWLMIGMMTLWSAGSHLLMPVRSSISMDLATDGRKGRRLGQIQGAGLAASVLGCILVWVLLSRMPKNYTLIYIIGGLIAIGASVLLFLMRMPEAHLRRPKFVWRKEYKLYYMLAFLFGARKQIFITFGPWVLVKVFEQEAIIFAQLLIVSYSLGVVFQPLLGRVIDRFGERKVLMVDSVLIFAVCMGYGFADKLVDKHLALWLLYACFVGDQMLFGVNMARATYLSKIALKPEDVSPSLSLAQTIDHAVSMSVPALGGLVWLTFGHSWVFVGAAGVAVIMFLVSSQVRIQPAPQRAEEQALAPVVVERESD